MLKGRSIGQKQGQTEFVWDLKDPGVGNHQVRTFLLLFLKASWLSLVQIVINPSDNSKYQLWAFRKV
jgi:hypothetical protein